MAYFFWGFRFIASRVSGFELLSSEVLDPALILNVSPDRVKSFLAYVGDILSQVWRQSCADFIRWNNNNFAVFLVTSKASGSRLVNYFPKAFGAMFSHRSMKGQILFVKPANPKARTVLHAETSVSIGFSMIFLARD